MLKFQKYPDIENSYREKFKDCIFSEGLNGGEWVVQEKIHGSNFAVYLDPGSCLSATRRKFLNKGEPFYGYKNLLKRYESPLNNLSEAFNRSSILYCEIFGGSYLHPGVQPVKNAIKVQKGVQYCPFNTFMIYDIWIDEKFLPPGEVIHLGEHVGLPFIPVLFKGSYEDCLNYSNEFQTTIPQFFGLPEIENNICEGIVIKPVEAKFLHGGSRVILKSKNERFSEKQKKRKLLPVPLSDMVSEIAENLFLYITENRLRNVLSHLGSVTNKDFGLVLGEFNKDIFKDYQAENDNLLNTLDKTDRKRVQKLVNGRSATLIRNNFLNIIDGVF